MGAAQTTDQRLERLAAQLMQHVRAQDGRTDARSARAIEALGEQMIHLAQTLERRIAVSEAKSAAALDALEARLEAEILGVNETLSATDLRAARALDDVVGQVSGATERLEARQAEQGQDLSERLRQNEARIAALLEDTRRQFEARFGAPPPGLAVETVTDQAPIAEDTASEPVEAVETPPEPQAASTSDDDLTGEAFMPAPLPIEPARRVRRADAGRRTAWLILAVAVCLGVGGAGLVLMAGGMGRASATKPAPRAVEIPSSSLEPAIAPAPAVATEPRAILPPLAPTHPPAAPSKASYADVVRSLEAGEIGAFQRLKILAESGDAQAQTYVGTAYENGLFGVARNKVEARRWTDRGAKGGDAAAMHNLGLFYFAGDGVDKDLPTAARWFRAAAERGVADSQYNLAMLYQAGTGVPRDLPEAYKWFSIAARGGDAQARTEAKALETRLNAGELEAATRSVQAFRTNRTGRALSQS